MTCADLKWNLDHCLVLLIPPATLAPSPVGVTEIACGHARTLACRFPQHAWIAAELVHGPNDKAQLDALRELSAASDLPLAVADDLHMHARSRRALRDTLATIRHGATVDQAGNRLLPNAERHLRTRLALACTYSPELLAESVAIPRRYKFSLDALRYEYPMELVPAGQTTNAYLREIAQ